MPKALIHYAAYRGHVVGLTRELAAGVSPNVPDSMQCTPPHLMCHFGGVWPAVVYGEDYDEATAVMDYVECCRLLIEAGTNVNAVNVNGDSVLFYAVQGGRRATTLEVMQVVEMLLAAGADVHYRGWLSATPLHSAAAFTPAAVDRLIKAGAEVNVSDDDDYTPLDSAMDGLSGIPTHRSFPLLLRAGADLPARPAHPLQHERLHPYLEAVIDAGGFARYAQRHLATITALFARTERLPPEMVRHVVGFWLHAGYYVY